MRRDWRAAGPDRLIDAVSGGVLRVLLRVWQNMEICALQRVCSMIFYKTARRVCSQAPHFYASSTQRTIGQQSFFRRIKVRGSGGAFALGLGAKRADRGLRLVAGERARTGWKCVHASVCPVQYSNCRPTDCRRALPASLTSPSLSSQQHRRSDRAHYLHLHILHSG